LFLTWFDHPERCEPGRCEPDEREKGRAARVQRAFAAEEAWRAARVEILATACEAAAVTV
jgi:hypothetical protein